VGVRGATRNERWGGFCDEHLIRKIVRPAELLGLSRSSTDLRRTPALRTLRELIEGWRDFSLQWGPTGSVGFELARGRQVTNEASDLDLAIDAPNWIAPEQARSLWDGVTGLHTKVDIRVEAPKCSFSLEEYAHASSSRILLRYPDGIRLGEHPWDDPYDDSWNGQSSIGVTVR
jgi:phosphoribosyl-dephospho-CoA transferase